MATATDNERTLGTIVKELTADISLLLRSEIALLKLELKDTFGKIGGGAAFLAAALFVGLLGLAFLFVTIVLGLVALGVPAWLSSLIVTVVLLVVAGVCALMGKKKLSTVNFVPTESVEQIKTDIDSIKAEINRVRSK